MMLNIMEKNSLRRYTSTHFFTLNWGERLVVLAVLYRIELEKAHDLSKEGEENKVAGRGGVNVCLGYSSNYKQKCSICDQQVRG